MEEVDEGSHCKGTVSKRRWWNGGEGTVLWPKKGLDSSMERKAPPTSALPHNKVPTVATLDQDGSSTFVGVWSRNINNPVEGEWPFLMYVTKKHAS